MRLVSNSIHFNVQCKKFEERERTIVDILLNLFVLHSFICEKASEEREREEKGKDKHKESVGVEEKALPRFNYNRGYLQHLRFNSEESNLIISDLLIRI